MRKLLIAGIAVMTMLPLTVAARGRIGVFMGPAFAPLGWYGPLYAPYPYGPYYGVPNAGEVKLDTKVKDAEVFINGAYAGTAGKLKTMWMRPGTYTIELRAAGLAPYTEKVFVVPGKTVHVTPGLQAQ